MRNKVQLYIGGLRADLDNGAFLLLNYTQEDLSNPTIIKNSFSRQIALKGTPANNKIFGEIYRNDRVTQYGGSGTGVYFDPTRKTPFTIYNETGEILEDGYVKLDKITRTKKSIEYTISLYGGLGSFLYGLSYDTDGNKLSLADLNFGETLDFTINRASVREAWGKIGHNTGSAKWAIINFAPGYMGLPPSPFDANKCLVHAYSVGLKYREGDYQVSGDGYTIVTLNDKVTGDAAKDYRSYLQKPVIKMSAIINAICDPANNGGYTVNLDSGFFDNTNDYWENSWLTLPSLNDLNVDESSTTNTQTMTALNTMLPIVGGGSAGLYGVTINLNMCCYMSGLPAQNFKLWFANSMGRIVNMLVFTVHLYDSSQNEIATAVYRVTTDGISVTSQYPQPDFTFDHVDAQGYMVDAGGNPVTFPLFIEATGASYYKVEMSAENYVWGSASFQPGDQSWRMWLVGESTATNNYYLDPRFSDSQVDVTGSSSSSIRTGATITKAMLLGGGHTPAEYLLSFCKLFGLQILCHKGEKVIDIKRRTALYLGTITDINGRIDRSRPIEKVPFAFDARWYLFGNEAKGEFAEFYQSRYNRPYGQFRVNTGYEFDAEEHCMTEDIIFGNLVSLMEASPYYCDLKVNNTNVPAVFLGGGKYTLWNGSDTVSLDLPYLAGAAKTWYNPSYPMHDAWDQIQFHGDQNAHLDESDTLVFFNGMKDTSSMHLSLTDDNEAMLYLNGNNPCWLPNWCDINPADKISELPHFSRYYWAGPSISSSFDFGDPIEIQIPGADIALRSNLYDQFWRRYIEDRYDDDSAVITCYVDLRGMQVGQELLRNFYAFDGAVWALNRIINHSLTTSGPTQCEFVKIQDTNNYTSY